MTVKIITDSSSDITPKVAKDLGITIAPVSIKSGDEVSKKGTEATADRLKKQPTPSYEREETAHPSPEDFAGIYTSCAKKADGIISIHPSSRTSGAYNAAVLGKKLARVKCQIEVIDSTFASVGLALVVMAAARQAGAGKNLLGVFDETQKAIEQVSMLAVLDSIEYVESEGQIGKVKLAMVKMLGMKPVLTFTKGKIIQTGLVRKKSDGLEKLLDFAASCFTIQDIAIAHSNLAELAEELKERLGSYFPEENIYSTRLGSSPGVLSSPGTLVLALRGH